MKTDSLAPLLGLWLVVGSWAGGEPTPADALRTASSDIKRNRSVRDTVTQYLEHIRLRESRAAFALTTKGSGTSWGNDFPNVVASNPIRPRHQLSAKEHAMVISNPFPSRGRTEVFYAFLVRTDGRWLINRAGRAEPDDAIWLMTGYLVNPAVKVEARPEEIVGRWWALCDSTIVMSRDGTGTELVVGPGGPVPGQRPKSFTWTVEGSQLLRRFSDRHEKLEITWLDDRSIRFRHPNDSGWGHWGRRDEIELPDSFLDD
jgi:hypothetical protein